MILLEWISHQHFPNSITFCISHKPLLPSMWSREQFHKCRLSHLWLEPSLRLRLSIGQSHQRVDYGNVDDMVLFVCWVFCWAIRQADHFRMVMVEIWSRFFIWVIQGVWFRWLCFNLWEWIKQSWESCWVPFPWTISDNWVD